jgi:hypothetical protein
MGGFQTITAHFQQTTTIQMNLNKKLAPVWAFVLSTGTAFANLGDTLPASILKYGNPLSSKSPVMNFRNGECFVSETFNSKGRCVFVRYVLGTNQRHFSEEEIKDIVRANIPNGDISTGAQTDGVFRKWQLENILVCQGPLVYKLGGSDVALDSISIGDKEGWRTALNLGDRD